MTRAEMDRELAKRINAALPDISNAVKWLGDGSYGNRSLKTAVALLEDAAGRLTLRATQ